MKKNYKGFTLIELIVVIAIIGVLAAILVPAMMGWVRKASINSANANAKTVFTNAQTCAQEFETAGKKYDGNVGSQGTTSTDLKSSGATAAGKNLESEVQRNISGTVTDWEFRVENYIVKAAICKTSGWTGSYPHAKLQTSTKKDATLSDADGQSKDTTNFAS